MKSTLFKSAVILSVAALISKLLGSLFRVPLQNIAGDEVLGIFTLVYPVYMVALILSVAGIPIAISKLIAEARAEQDTLAVRHIYSTARILAIVFGIVSFSLIWLFSAPLAEQLGGQETRLALVIVATTLLVAPYMAVYRGYFQGHQSMNPTAISQVIEQFVRVGLILAIALYLVRANYATETIAGGIMVGSFFGALASLIYLLSLYAKSDVRIRPETRLSTAEFTKRSKQILKLSLPIAFGAITMALLNLVDSLTIPTALANFLGTTENITYQYGIYGRGLTIVQIVTVFASSVILPLIPTISAKLVKGEKAEATRLVSQTFFLTALLSVPAAIGLVVLTTPINLGLFTDTTGNEVLAIISFSSLFTSLTILGTGVLQGMDKAKLAAWLIVGAVAVKWVLNLTLVANYGLTGAAYSTLIIYVLLTVANGIAIRRFVSIPWLTKNELLVIVAAVIMGAVIYLPMQWMDFEDLGRLVALGYVAVAAIIGGILYFAILLVTKALSPELLQSLPVIGKRLTKTK
ncbi:polysaccharide biosynthesis protein [Chryseomicrobium sp. FSL W7-1435]|uniref:putative polysaccharide biosynthesis protein n=1 Tax=Chryseomicrobium sp. FSL W7-1435 TaxID=2921704 RepID=UPI003159FE82